MYLSVLLGMVGPWQIVIIVALALLFFGGKKIPELMKGLGQGVKEFKKATKDFEDDGGKANPQKELESKSE
jgi:sec-independent protein translocase protein TatA